MAATRSTENLYGSLGLVLVNFAALRNTGLSPTRCFTATCGAQRWQNRHRCSKVDGVKKTDRNKELEKIFDVDNFLRRESLITRYQTCLPVFHGKHTPSMRQFLLELGPQF